MDRWSYVEMLAVKNRSYPSLSEEAFCELMKWCVSILLGEYCVVTELFGHRYGPIPRYVFEQTRDKDQCQWNIKITTALNSTDLYKSLVSVSCNASTSVAPDSVSHTVIHLRSSSPFLQHWYSLASSWVGKEVIV